ncbi:hypothetical protein PHYSODRAFT_342514, partial [Phytophthora sojae]
MRVNTPSYGTSSDSGAKEPDLRHEMVHDGPTSFNFSNLYRYATTLDKVLLAVGIVTTGANGALFPLMAIVFGDVLTGFTTTPVDMDKVNSAALDYLYITIFLFITDYVSWYDAHDALQLSSRLTGNTVRIRDGMGHKLGDSLRYSIQFVVGFIIGSAHGWNITLVMACVMLVMALSLNWMIKTFTIMSDFAQKVYAEAGSVAKETLGSIRTVASLNGEQKAIE